MKSLKLVSGFDGTWTNQELEGEYIWNYAANKLSEMTRFSENEIRQLLDESKSDMSRAPYEYGWMYNGKLAAFYREDPFGDYYALFNYIERAGSANSFSVFKQKLAEIKKTINSDKKYESLEKFSSVCFSEAAKKFKEAGKLSPAPNAKAAFDKVLNKGVDVVIASNSTTEKIEHLFMKLGQQPTNERSFKRSNVYAKGNSMKFAISPDYKELPESLQVKKYYDVQLRRKSYHHLLLEEIPDFVIGNVFSLDIALPLYLSMNDPKFKDLKVIQIAQKYTPDWVKEYLSKDEFKGIACIIDNIKELPDVISWN